MDQSKQALRDIGDNANLTCASSLKEITLIETVTSFLEENGAAEIDRKVLRTLAEALSKSVDDSTSPGVLQDVTMDNSYASFDAGRLQGDSHSPLAMPGRSMRNVEEQMSSLRKENFNLKLRLYFMEESQLGHQRTNHSGESLSKQLIDAKIEAEVLRKTVEEKTELLKDAARAISLHEEMQRKAETESQALIDELQQHLRHYEETENAVEGDTRAVLEEKLKHLDAEVLRLRQELVEAGLRQIACQEQLKSAQAEHQETLSSCEAKIEELAIKNAELVEQIEKDTQCSGETNAKQEMDAQLADNMCELQDAQEKLKERERIHEQACRTIQKLMQKLSSQDKEIKRLNQLQQQPDQNSVKKEEENSQASISPLASSGRSLSDNEACSLEISAALKEQYEHTMAEQELKIKQLQAEVKKKTANLQNLVNKELWEKNREVERLTKLVAANQQQQQQSLPQINEDANGSMDLQQSFTEVEYAKALERNKLLQRKVDVLIHRLGEDQQNSAVIGQLRQELRQVQADAESANKWRLECADVCGVLTNRLEELAGFLNSLLKHKDVLGALAADRRHAMRRAVDRSLDLSKSLNMTLNITGTSLADQSLAQLCNLSEMLYTDADADADADAEADASHKTYNSHEEIRAAASAGAGAAISPTLEHLKAENKALKRELEKRRSTDGQQQRKERRSLPLPMQQLDNQSESEAWSEPDRKVSLARIGLEETSHSLATAEHRASESESEGRRACSARQERSRHSERIAQLEEQIAQRDERVLNVQCQMVDLDNRYKQEQLRCMEISQQMEQLRAVNEALKADLQAIGTQEDQQMDELQRLVELKTKQIDQLELAKSTLTADAQVTDMELQAAQQQLLQMEQEHAVAVDQAQAELAQLKLEAAQKLEEVQRLHQEALERDWVALSIYQEQTRELLELQRSLEYHQENEIELKQTLVENELATRALKKQLDESTLQASKAVMERTKAYNEKLQLEKRTEELRLQLELLKNGQQQQQRQPPARSNSSDVSQSGYTSEEVAVPMGPPNGIHSTVPANMAVVVGRMNSSSPDLGIESDAGRISSVDLCPATQRAIHTTVELHNDTLSGVKDEPVSPDTGNALNVSQQQQQPSAAATIAHDCAKVDQENAELRRKLIRTKRAFEDTYEKLRLANKAKAQVEKDIKNQILKTHNVLRNVRSNMENEL